MTFPLISCAERLKESIKQIKIATFACIGLNLNANITKCNNIASTGMDILRDKNLRVTPFRKEVLEIFLENEHAISIQDIEEALVEFDRITLYRTIRSEERRVGKEFRSRWLADH